MQYWYRWHWYRYRRCRRRYTTDLGLNYNTFEVGSRIPFKATFIILGGLRWGHCKLLRQVPIPLTFPSIQTAKVEDWSFPPSLEMPLARQSRQFLLSSGSRRRTSIPALQGLSICLQVLFCRAKKGQAMSHWHSLIGSSHGHTVIRSYSHTAYESYTSSHWVKRKRALVKNHFAAPIQ